jgi:hypothetical protein
VGALLDMIEAGEMALFSKLLDEYFARSVPKKRKVS